MGFWSVPFITGLTASSLDPRVEFVMVVASALAGAEPQGGGGADAETVGAVMLAASTATLSSYGATTPLNRAYAFLLDWAETQTLTRRSRTATAAASALRIAGATDVRSTGPPVA